MVQLNELENAVLEAMCARDPEEADTLRAQIKTADVIRRINTGVGFYAYFRVRCTSLLLNRKELSGVFAKIYELRNPMTFVLFVRNGVIHMLEGASIDDGTSNVDFSTVTFNML